jgi:hypothetical protein
MKLEVTLYRVASIPTGDLAANLKKTEGGVTEAQLRERFGVLAPRFKIWVGPVQPRKSLAGMEVMSFSVLDAAVPQAGLVHGDPIDPQELARIDGGLRGELERLGIQSDAAEYEWRLHYVVKGN